MARQHRRARWGAAAVVALCTAACTLPAQGVTFTTAYLDGAQWNAIYAQGFSPSEVPNPDPALATDAIVPLDRFQFFKSGQGNSTANIRLAIVTNLFLNLQTFTTSSPELMHGPVGNQVSGLSINTIAGTAAIPTGGPITFHFNDLPLVYGNDYAAIYVTEGLGGALTPVLVPSLIADYVEDPPGSGMYRPESDYGVADLDYFKSVSNYSETDAFGTFLKTFNGFFADATFRATFDLPPEDYDHDSKWDNLDFAAWKDEFGQTGAGLDADSEGDSDADGADFLYWQVRHGEGVPGAAAVPEPAALVLAALAALLALGRRRGA